MTTSLIYFAVPTLAGLLYVFYYKEFVLAPKKKKLTLVNEFRYARNLNTELIHLFRKFATELKAAPSLYNGLTFDEVMNELQAWHDKIYTDATFRLLVGTEKKVNQDLISDLQADIYEQIKIQHEVKANFSKTVGTRSRLAAA